MGNVGSSTAKMKKRILKEQLAAFEKHLEREERSEATRQKYLRDVTKFYERVKTNDLSKEKIVAYKADLLNEYAVSSSNSMIAALNAFGTIFASSNSSCNGKPTARKKRN